MRLARTALSALALTALLACEPVLEPEATAADPSPVFAVGRVGQSVTGSGSFLFGAFNRTFSFTARIHADGSVAGQWQRVTHNGLPGQSRSHGEITCLNIVGNQAWLGGFKTLSTTGNVDPPNNGVIWRVIDNGQGRRAPPDQMSGQGVGRSPEAVASYCTDTPGGNVFDLTAGNIQVR